MYFIVDANMPSRLANGLELIDQENVSGNIKVQVKHSDDLLGKGATDEQIIIFAGKVGGIIISEDDDFKRIKSNKKLVEKLNVGYVLYKPPKHGARYWEKAKAFILGWEHLKDKIKATSKPFIMIIDKSGHIKDESF